MTNLRHTDDRSMTMKPITGQLLLVALLVVPLAACQESRGERTYVQTNYVSKDVLEGEWYYERTVADHNYESVLFTFRGDMAWDYSTFSASRIRWVIDENYLYAVRTYEVVEGSNLNGQGSTYLGEPVAAFPIESHFDIVRQYNPTTGETGIVLDENTSDRFWWERQYIRVDWSTNNVLGYYWAGLDAYEGFGYVTREPAPFFCDEGSECPDNWQMRIETADCPDVCRDAMRVPAGGEADFESAVEDCAAELGATPANLAAIRARPGRTGPLAWADLAPWWTHGCEAVDDLVDDPGTGEQPPYYISFVTQEIWSPFTSMYINCDPTQAYPCTSFRIAVRNTFFRSTSVPDYEPINVKNSMWDRFGIIRLEKQVYSRGSLPDEQEGLTRDYGITDALNYWGAKHDIWANDLNVGPDGRRLPKSYRPRHQRAVKPIIYTLTPHFPPYLVDPSMQAVAEWNDSLMAMVRRVRSIPLPGETADAPPYDCALVHPSRSDCSGSDNCDPHEIAEFGGSLEQFEARAAYRHRFEGTECALKLEVNACDADPSQPCVELGDIRHHFWAMIDIPGAPFGGVSLPLQDPRDGRLISANVNICKDSIEGAGWSALVSMGRFGDVDDLVGEGWGDVIFSNEELMSGEDRRAYFSNRGKVEFPALLAPYGSPAGTAPGAGAPAAMVDPLLTAPPDLVESARALFADLRPRLERLRGVEGRAQTFSARLQNLRGTDVERRLAGTFDSLLAYADQQPPGLRSLPTDLRPTDEAVLDAVSPFRRSLAERLGEMHRQDQKRFDARHCFFPIYDMIDESVVNLARELGGYTTRQVAIEIRRRINKWIFMHEFGHSLGMEHNFAASTDRINYHDEYYAIGAAHPWPNMSSEDYMEEVPDPEDPTSTRMVYRQEGLARYEADVTNVRHERELDGIDTYHFSSVMDYPAETYNYFHDLGYYDKAYALFAYGLLAEVYEGDPRLLTRDDESVQPFVNYDSPDCEEDDEGVMQCPPECVEQPDGTFACTPRRRIPFVFYLGGETCTVDSDCPYARDKGMLAPAVDGVGFPAQEGVLAQRCVTNYRQRELDTTAAQLPMQCSNFDQDWKAYVADRDRASPPVTPSYYPVKYKNCGNSRVNDISWCTMHDEGASFREVVANMREQYHRIYPTAYFRRYRNAYYGYNMWRYLDFFGKMYQHFWYRLFYEGGDFDINTDATIYWGFGAWDQMLASADAFNFMAEVIATPDVGSYDYDPFTNSYIEKASAEYGLGDMDVDLGLGKYMWSAYETGIEGFWRVARQGLVGDKILAMTALVLRDWGLTYGMDERYYFNFYDFFTSETNQLFTGLMLDNAYWYGPRMTGTTDDPRLSYISFWKGFICGSTLYGGGIPDYCNPDPREAWPATIPAVGGGSNDIIRDYAVAFALAEFPVFFDTSYEQQMYVALDGGADYFNIPGCDVPQMLRDGLTENDPDPEQATCVVYESDRLHKTYVAALVAPREPWTSRNVPLMYRSIAGELLRDMNRIQTLVGALEDPETPPDLLPEGCRSESEREECLERGNRRLTGHEAFLITLMDMMHRYGISSWF